MLPPGSELGMAAISPALSKPRLLGIGSSTFAPSLKVISDSRSCAASNELTNVRAASRTAGHCAPIEPDTSRTSDRSTIRRVASPLLATVTWLTLATRMNVVGSVAVAETVTTLTPLAALTVEVKKLAAAVGSDDASVPCTRREVRLEDLRRLRPRDCRC